MAAITVEMLKELREQAEQLSYEAYNDDVSTHQNWRKGYYSGQIAILNNLIEELEKEIK